MITTNPDKFQRPTVAHVNLANLTYNFRSVKEFVGSDVLFMAVVKADAYGHGAAACARQLEQDGVDWFGVAILEEALELRIAGIVKPILCLGGLWEGQETEALLHEVTPVIFDLNQAKRLSTSAKELRSTATVHVKIDTGMGRIGVPFSETPEFARRLREIPNLNVEAIMTHFAAADDLSERDFTVGQIAKLHQAVEIFEAAGFSPPIIDMANSPGAVGIPESKGNMVRIGGLLYGLGGDVLPSGIPKPELKPVMSVTTLVAQVKDIPSGTSLGYGRTFTTSRDSVIGTLPIGYQDGYRRAFSNRGHVIVNGKFAPIIGRISMDWTIIDLTDIPGSRIGDTAVIIGQDEGLAILAEDLAAAADTISYEITCGISRRVPRIYS